MQIERMSERKHFTAHVDVMTTAHGGPRRLWAENLSEQGMYIQTTRGFQVGDRLALRFDLDGAEVYVRAAEVTWVRPYEPINVTGQMPGAGVRFLAVDPPHRAVLRRFANRTDIDGPVSVHVDPSLYWHESLHGAATLPPSSGKGAAVPRHLTLPPLSEGMFEPTENTNREDVEYPLIDWAFRVVSDGSFNPSPRPKKEPTKPKILEPEAYQLEPDAFQIGELDVGAPERAGYCLGEMESKYPTLEPMLTDEIPGLDDEVAETSLLEHALYQKAEQRFSQGELSVSEMPSIPDRSATRKKKAMRGPLKWAVGFFAVGAAGGAALAVFDPGMSALLTDKKTKAIVAPPPLQIAAAPVLSVAEVEAPLTDAPVKKEAAADALVAAQVATPVPVPTPTGDLPRRVESAPAAQEAAAAPLASQAPPPPADTPGMRVEWGRVQIPLTGGKVSRSFILKNPARVVVDLVGIEGSANLKEQVGSKGIAEIRMGKPDPEHVRVVVELATAKTPRKVSTLKKHDALAIAWK
jgi:hypothetical protein